MSTLFRRVLESRFRLSTQLYLGIGGAVFTTMAAAIVGWFSFDRVGDAQTQVNDRSVPEVVAAFGIAQHSGTLVNAAPRLTAVGTPHELALVASSIEDGRLALEGQLAVLGVQTTAGNTPSDANVLSSTDGERIRSQVDTLVLNINAIRNEMSDLFKLKSRLDNLREDLEDVRILLDDILVSSVDDQLFYTMTGFRELGSGPAPREQHFSEDEFAHYRHMAELQADARIATHLLESAFAISEAPLVEPLRERFEAAAGRIQRNLAGLEGSPLGGEVEPVLTRLFALGIGADDGFDLLEQELRLVQRQQDLLALNRDIAVDLVTDVDVLVSTARASAEEATEASTQAILTGRTLLLAISGISVGGALLIAWLFVGRILLRRLQMLSTWMRQMAGGDLEARVEIGGRDEVADMAAALEVFRRHALEVQRLNLVEKLAEELQGKNEQLESVLADLQRAQDQIVMREKLAALGELTAGVAHEIRNPLNFVKNFSEVSEELLEELRETLDEVGENLDDEHKGLIDDISGDLISNLERIRSHGERANRIVHDMLMMGRGSGESQPTDLNGLLDEYAKLAYHSARATDPNFQLDLRHDLDPSVGEVDVIPQDLGRVFLNMVGNACHATEERRAASEETRAGGERYMPTLWLASRRREEDIEIRIKDNGSGIPDDIVESIFNPFFTTKPTGQGTGLGLAMSSDIVREHGGTIKVETEPGEFTEMILTIPLVPPVKAVEPGDDEAPVTRL